MNILSLLSLVYEASHADRLIKEHAVISLARLRYRVSGKSTSNIKKMLFAVANMQSCQVQI